MEKLKAVFAFTSDLLNTASGAIFICRWLVAMRKRIRNERNKKSAE